jgi:hypothetical protein
MALTYEQLGFVFPLENFTPGTGQKEISITLGFEGQNVQYATAVLQSFDLRYQGPNDHHVLQETVSLTTDVSDLGVRVTCRILLRDGSGNIDDPFIGNVQAVVIADIA